MPRKKPQKRRGRARKPGPRTESGRLSRAYKRNPECRDTGTREMQAKRAYLINGSDPQLAASASGILLANGFLTRGQHAAALTYSWAHALTYGRPWRQACPLGERTGTAPPDERLVKAKAKLAEMDAKLTPEQRQGGRQRCGVRVHPAVLLHGAAAAS